MTFWLVEIFITCLHSDHSRPFSSHLRPHDHDKFLCFTIFYELLHFCLYCFREFYKQEANNYNMPAPTVKIGQYCMAPYSGEWHRVCIAAVLNFHDVQVRVNCREYHKITYLTYRELLASVPFRKNRPLDFVHCLLF
jgi:hypothetical protein